MPMEMPRTLGLSGLWGFLRFNGEKYEGVNAWHLGGMLRGPLLNGRASQSPSLHDSQAADAWKGLRLTFVIHPSKHCVPDAGLGCGGPRIACFQLGHGAAPSTLCGHFTQS